MDITVSQQLWKACLLGTTMTNQSKGESWVKFIHQLNPALQKARPTTLTKVASRAQPCLDQPEWGQSHVRTSYCDSTGRVSGKEAGQAQPEFLFGKTEKETSQKKTNKQNPTPNIQGDGTRECRGKKMKGKKGKTGKIKSMPDKNMNEGIHESK